MLRSYETGVEILSSEQRERVTKELLKKPFIETTNPDGDFALYDEAKLIKKVYLPGRNPEAYNLTIRDFDSPETFLEGIRTHPGKIDELVVKAHGSALFLQVNSRSNNKGSFYIDRLRQEIEADPELFEGIVSVDELAKVKDVEKIRDKFNRDAFCTSHACYTFGNYGKDQPIFGAELARLLNIPVIGGVRQVGWGESRSGDRTGLPYYSVMTKEGKPSVLTAVPKTWKIEIVHNPVQADNLYFYNNVDINSLDKLLAAA